MKETKKSDSLHDLWGNIEKQKSIPLVADWDKVYRRIVFHKNSRRFLNFARNAAAILLPILLLWHFMISPSAFPEKIIYTEVSSSSSGVTKVLLPDGSKVWLNASSKITYPQKFTTKARTVRLDGEGYFSVSANKNKRFDVIIDNAMRVSAYGTEFNVTAYPESKQYRVLLTKGNVDVEALNTQEVAQLKPGQEATISSSTAEIKVCPADAYTQTAWKDGKMVFYREKLGAITEKLSKRFDVQIYFAEPHIKEQIYTGTFTTEGITEILDLFKQSAPIDYTVKTTGDINNSDRKRTIVIKQK